MDHLHVDVDVYVRVWRVWSTKIIKEDYKGGGHSVEEVDEIIVEGCLKEYPLLSLTFEKKLNLLYSTGVFD